MQILFKVAQFWMPFNSREHGSPAETKPDSTLLAQGVKMDYILLDLKLGSKFCECKDQSLLKN